MMNIIIIPKKIILNYCKKYIKIKSSAKKWKDSFNELADLEKCFISKYLKRNPRVHKLLKCEM